MPRHPSEHPTPDLLAGVYVEVAGEETITEAALKGPSQPLPPPVRQPTTDELAGVNIEVAGEETIHLPPSNP